MPQKHKCNVKACFSFSSVSLQLRCFDFFLPFLRHGITFLVEAAAAFPRITDLKSVKMLSPALKVSD